MRVLRKYKKKFLLIFVCLSTPFQVALSDVVTTTENEKIICVVTERTDESIVVVTKSGKKILPRDEIQDIKEISEKDNLLLLAEFARENNDNVKAYYLYEKVLEIDPDSEDAVKGLTIMEESLNWDNSDDNWVRRYERFYQKVSSKKSESDILSDNSDITEELMVNFGIILISEKDRVKISEVIYNSRGYKSGFQINDYILSVDQMSVDYLGLYDTVIQLNNRKSNSFNVNVERHYRVWNEGEEDTLSDSLDFTDYSLSEINSMYVFIKIRENSSIYNAGIREKDRLVGIKGIKISDTTDKKVLSNIIRTTGAEFIDIAIIKTIKMDNNKN